MTGAIHGRAVANGPTNPIAAMEPRWPLPFEEQERLLAKLNIRLDSLPGPLDKVLALVVYTAYRAGWKDSNDDTAAVRAAEERREMDGAPETLRDGVRIEAARRGAEPGQVLADVTSRVPDDPAAVGRGRA